MQVIAIKRVVDKIVAWINIILLGIMVVLVTYQVIARYFFNAPSTMAETLAQYMFVWIIMYGSSYTFGLREHLEISVLKDKLPPKARFLDDMLIDIVLVLFALGVMGCGGFALTKQQMGVTDAALQIPMGVIYSAIPINAILILFYAVYLIMDDHRLFLERSQQKGGNE